MTCSSKRIVTALPVVGVRLLPISETTEQPEIHPTPDEPIFDVPVAAAHDMEAERQKAWDEGYEAARAELSAVHDQAEHEIDAVRQAAETLKSIAEAMAENHHTLQMTEQTLISLACAIAGKVIHQKVDENNELVVNSVRSALESIHQTKSITIRVHPDDMEVIAAHEPAFKSMLDHIENAEIIPDAGVSRGGCMVNTDSGTIDGCLSVQLSEIERTLLSEGDHEENIPNESIGAAFTTE